jgi:phospholipid/cholesterol/gamma-HCH transport system ATP-binding protein
MLLRFQNVTVSFDEKAALRDISFEVRTGETMVLFGAASSGKTVLLKTSIGLIQPDSGEVHLDGQNIMGRPERELLAIRRRVGVLFQEGGLFDSLTVHENVAFPLLNPPDRRMPDSVAERRVKETLQSVGLESAAEKFPSELSGGMRRRVGIARATVTKPPLILYDSPTAGLDPITAYRIVALLIRQRDTANTTTIMVTHRYQDAHLLANFRHDAQQGRPVKVSDALPPTRFLVLREGRTEFLGSEAEMRASADPYIAKFVRRPVGNAG